MKILAPILILISTSIAFANSGRLVLSGVVHSKAEIRFDLARKTFLSLSTTDMKVEVHKTNIASIIRVSAP